MHVKTYLLQLLLGCFGPMFTLFWVYVGPSWDYVGTRLDFVELSFGPMLGFVGLSLAHLGTMLPPRGCFGPTFTLF